MTRDPQSQESPSPASDDRSSETTSPAAALPELPPEAFLGAEPSHDLAAWLHHWRTDPPLPVRSHRRGLAGWLVTRLKRWLRPLVRMPLAAELERQRNFDYVIALHLLDVGRQIRELHDHVHVFQREHQQAIEAHAAWLQTVDERTTDGFADLVRHNDALFARVDQKLDRYRRQARHLWSRLGAFVAAQEAEPARPLRAAQREGTYLELERRYRGSEEEIESRISAYLPYLQDRSPILDLGCGRGEALALLGQHGVEASGVDSSAEMVARCREKDLDVEEGDLLEALRGRPEGSLGAVVSFHVVEHLVPDDVDRLVRLAWRALRPDGVLILETPSPLSVVTSARSFWLDPTHVRPVHPQTLELLYREAGFEPVHRLDLHPFPDDERLPEIDLEKLPDDQHALAHQVNRLRDLLDELLYGYRDYGLVGLKG